MVKLNQLVSYLDDFLNVKLFRDYCENGLQVEGREDVSRIVAGVTASEALLDAAIEHEADAILVHHGYFWKGEVAAVTGMKKKRLKKLLSNDISLLAYHLPLDVHEKVGNNVQLAQLLGLSIDGPLETGNPRSVGLVGQLPEKMSAKEFADCIALKLHREPMMVADPSQEIQRIAWCTGAAQGYMELALSHGVDAYLSGEISEQTVHTARETGVAYYAAGHHATERYGVQALGKHLQQQFDIDYEFVDIDNPV